MIPVTTTARVLAILEAGPATRRQIADALGLQSTKIRNVMSPLVDRGCVAKIGEAHQAGCPRPVAVYGLVGTEMTRDTTQIVAAALASRHPLEMVWA